MSAPDAPDLEALIAGLGRPSAYPHPVDRVEVRQTHASVVFLAGPYAYKLKKPLDLGFLDYSTRERRLRFCREEVRLNLRLAPGIYLDVVPVQVGPDGFRVGRAGEDPEAEPMVRMVRLPDSATFRSRLGRGELAGPDLARLGARLAAFHREHRAGPDEVGYAGFGTVAGNCRENFSGLVPFVGDTVEATVLARLERRTEEALARLAPVIEARAHGKATDGHGDLRLEHVYELAPGDLPAGIEGVPTGLAVLDGIEFQPRFRVLDPVADAAFLAMELEHEGHPELASGFLDAYLAASRDPGGADVVPFYMAYRHVVRGKVRSFESREPEIPEAARASARERARAHLLAALGWLEPPEECPALVLCSGLPGAGKSMVAGLLEKHHGFVRISSDRTRKRLAGLDPDLPVPTGAKSSLYSEASTVRTYRACREEAVVRLRAGERVVLDATWRRDRERAEILGLARKLHVPALWIEVAVPAEVARARISARPAGESDADLAIRERLAASWEPPGEDTLGAHRVLANETDPGCTAERLAGLLVAASLWTATSPRRESPPRESWAGGSLRRHDSPGPGGPE